MTVSSLRDIETIESARPDPFSSTGSTWEMIRDGAAIAPDSRALSFFLRVEDFEHPVSWSHAELLADITRAARMFRRLGVQRGDVVAYILPNLPETHIALWGAETAGIAFAVNPLLEAGQMGQLLRAADTRWVVTIGPQPDPEIWQRVSQASAAVPGLRGILLVDALRHLPGRSREAELPEPPGELRLLDFHAELEAEDGSELGFEPPAAGDIASYFCTGGTTGLPKIAQHSHRNETANALQVIAVLGEHIMQPGATVLTGLPLFHVNAQIGTGLSVLASGGHVLLATAGGYRTAGLLARFWEIVEHHAVCSFSGVPTVYAGLLQAPRAGRDLSCLNRAICGAAPMPVDLFRKFEQETGMRILEGYGLTESACVASLNPPDGEAHIGSIGLRLPWQPMCTMLLDEDGCFLRLAEADEIGAICISGPNVFPGYLTAEQNEGIWLEAEGPDGRLRRWFNTGDLGRCDADGFFWLTGRRKELIIRGGHNIDPKTIEEALAAHPAVALAAAVGRPDPYAGEIPVAYVQLREGGQISEQQLLEYAAERISERAAVPKRIYVVDALPLTAVGKTFKPTLVMQEIESVIRDEATAADVTLDELQVEQDARLGILARYRLAQPESPQAAAFTAALGRYTFKSQSV
jgi:fatty-acyl-CoA synthase/long-chain acyl-CoA synthetase